MYVLKLVGKVVLFGCRALQNIYSSIDREIDTVGSFVSLPVSGTPASRSRGVIKEMVE